MKGLPILRKAWNVVSRRSPDFLTAAGIAGLVGTVFLAIKASKKATLVADQIREESEPEAPDKKVIFKKLALVYLPTAVMGGLTVACIVGANRVSARRNAVIAGLYSASEYALKEYQNKVAETIGEAKERSVRDAVVKDQIDRNPVGENKVIVTGGGDMLCRDLWTGQYFKSNVDAIYRAQNEVNRQVINEMWVPANELYYQLGIDQVDSGKDVGWDVDHMLDIDFSSHLTSEKIPCLAIGYKVCSKYKN